MKLSFYTNCAQRSLQLAALTPLDLIPVDHLVRVLGLGAECPD